RRDVLVQDAARLFAEVEVVMTPTTAVAAFPAGGPPPDEIDGHPARPLGASATPFTMLANLCWNPAVSVPAGTSAGGVPITLSPGGRRHAHNVLPRLAR